MLTYLLKSGIILAIFYLFYKLLLEKEPIHFFKRIYLLGGLVMAFYIPLITFTTTLEVEPIVLLPSTFSKIDFEPQPLLEGTPIYYGPIILWTVYVFGVVLFGLKFLFNLNQISNKIRKNTKQKANRFTHVLLEYVITPHTFFSYIFLNKQRYLQRQIPNEVFWHEETHANQKHSLDVVFIEILQVVFWFNPLLYFIKNEIKLNHEFLADRAVLNKGVSLSAYQEILLSFSSNPTEPKLANALNYASMKKRFAIMKTKTSKKIVWIKSLILLPLIAVLMYSFSEKIIIKEAPKKAIQDQFYKLNKKNYVANSKQETHIPNIFVTINKNKDILINHENYATIESLKNEIDRILKDYAPNQISSVKVIIEADKSLKMGVIFEIESKIREATILKRELKLVDATYEQENATPEELVEYNKLATLYNNQPQDKRIIKLKDLNRLEYIFNKMTVKQKENAEPFPDCPPLPTKSQVKATKEQIAEYNQLAQHYNNMPQNNMIIRLEDMKSMRYIYDLMTEKQKKDAQPFPNFPPPPPPAKVEDKIIEGNLLPPPPQIPADASPEQKGKYNKATENYERHIGYTYKTESGEVIQVIEEVTPEVEVERITSPPTPPNPIDDMIEMSKNGAIFYYEGKKITSDKAIELTKKNKSINIQVINDDSSRPIVKLSMQPSTIEG